MANELFLPFFAYITGLTDVTIQVYQDVGGLLTAFGTPVAMGIIIHESPALDGTYTVSLDNLIAALAAQTPSKVLDKTVFVGYVAASSATVGTVPFCGYSISPDTITTVTGNVMGNVQGDVGGSVQGDVAGAVQGGVNGGVNGDIFGALTGNVQGDVMGNVNGHTSLTSAYDAAKTAAQQATILDVQGDVDAIETRLAAAAPGAAPVVVIAAPFSPSQSIGYTYCYDAAGNLDAKAQIEFSMVTPPATTDGTSYATYLTRKPYSLTDADPAKRGRLDVTLLKGATYRAKRTDDGTAVTVLVPDTDTFQLPQTLSRPAFQ